MASNKKQETILLQPLHPSANNCSEHEVPLFSHHLTALGIEVMSLAISCFVSCISGGVFFLEDAAIRTTWNYLVVSRTVWSRRRVPSLQSIAQGSQIPSIILQSKAAIFSTLPSYNEFRQLGFWCPSRISVCHAHPQLSVPPYKHFSLFRIRWKAGFGTGSSRVPSVEFPRCRLVVSSGSLGAYYHQLLSFHEAVFRSVLSPHCAPSPLPRHYVYSRML